MRGIFASRKKEWDKIEVEKVEIERIKEELRSREEGIRENERERDAGFADKTAKFEEKLSTLEISERNRILELLKKERKEKLAIFENEYDARKKEYGDIISHQQRALEQQRQIMEKTIEQLRETAKNDLEKELTRQKEEYEKFFAEQKNNLQEYKEQRKKELQDEYKEFSERLAKERSDFDFEIRQKKESQEKEFEQRNNDFETKIKTETRDLNQRKADLDKSENELDLKQRQNERKEEELKNREEKLNEEIEQKIEQRKKEYEQETKRLEDENSKLLYSVDESKRTIDTFEELKAKLGGEDPAAVLKQLSDYEQEIQSLRQELTERPSKEIEERFDEFKKEKEQLENVLERRKQEMKNMQEIVAETNSIRFENNTLKTENQSLKNEKENLQSYCNELQTELTRLQATYKNTAERDERIKAVETPHPQFKDKLRKQDIPTEIKWLTDIKTKIKEAEFNIPDRILYAFHTALKTAEWSPITVLAGVSGTGKSELPRLYSHFGGINFLSLAVQPNWDSQESMLGFFNSIDNKFDAQPVLQLLAQSQKEKSEEYKDGLKDTLNIILLDEMNLAHIELYFAEFLSKLELRRGKLKEEIPELSVKLGSGIEPYGLKLGRNVLWVGTMNQDETTKSLSDKVLDRGIIINFPRPKALQSRTKLTALGKAADLLPADIWGKEWCKLKSTLNEDETKKYREFIEEMNSHLAKAGRALGHRVWQSIEYYMSNYPIEENEKREDILRIAFEDQLVQKVMPKLKGIETRGTAKTECLDKIKKQLKDNRYNIVEDFEFACEFGYGQFSWNSAMYLEEGNK